MGQLWSRRLETPTYVICALIVLIASVSCEKTAHSQEVILSDTFNRANSATIDSNDNGLGGTVSQAYFEVDTVEINSNVLQLTDRRLISNARAAIDHNFVEPSIVASNGFTIEFDINPTDSGTGRFVTFSGWVGVNIGLSETDAKYTGSVTMDAGLSSFGILFRGHGGTLPGGSHVFGFSGPVATVYDTTPLSGDVYHVKLTITALPGQTIFTTGHEAEVLTEVTGNLDAPFFQTNTLQWKSNNNNYIVLESDTNDNFDGIKPSTLDNLVIASLEVPNQPPDCTNVAPSISELWPPNHNFHPVNIVGITDPEGDTVTITIDGVFQDEPVNSTADGNTAPDGMGVGTSTAQVRAERAGNSDGRVYHIFYTAADGNGGTCSGEVTVGVPHDEGQGPAIDSGVYYDSTVGP